MDPIEAWKRMTNMERRRVLETLKHYSATANDGRAFGVAVDVLQATQDTPVVESLQTVR